MRNDEVHLLLRLVERLAHLSKYRGVTEPVEAPSSERNRLTFVPAQLKKGSEVARSERPEKRIGDELTEGLSFLATAYVYLNSGIV